MSGLRSHRWSFLVVLALVASVIAAMPALASGSPDLFTTGPAGGVTPGTVRTRHAALTVPLETAAGPLRVTLDLFDDTAVSVTLERQPGSGPIVWTAAVPGRPGTSVHFVVDRGIAVGHIILGAGETYTVSGPVDGQVLIAQLDAANAEEAEPRVPPGEPGPPPNESRAAGGTVVDVMLLLTDDTITDSPYFHEEEGNIATPALAGQALRDKVHAWGELRIASWNSALRDSGVDLRVRLVYAGFVDYSETGDSSDDLDNLTFIAGQDCDAGMPGLQECDPEGHLDQVRGLRDQFGADLVFLNVWEANVGGVAWLNCSPGDPPHPSVGACEARWGYSVVSFVSASLGVVINHEGGHLLGNRHDAANGGFTYARGYQVIDDFATIMAYPASVGTEWLNLYSNPGILHGGTPIGVAVGDAGEADAATHMDLSGPLVEAFRDKATCGGLPVTIFGSNEADQITGTSGADVIAGFDGDDVIAAFKGPDTICGGDGKDNIKGNKGADTIHAGDKSDRLYGGKGDDELFGDGGTRDRLFGGPDSDLLNGGSGSDDRCQGGEANLSCEVLL